MYTVSNVILVDEKFTSFHKYLRHCHKKMLPLRLVYRAPSYEPNLTLLAWFLSHLAYLSMLFILQGCRAARSLTQAYLKHIHSNSA